jgi:hypothetical protein
MVLFMGVFALFYFIFVILVQIDTAATSILF